MYKNTKTKKILVVQLTGLAYPVEFSWKERVFQINIWLNTITDIENEYKNIEIFILLHLVRKIYCFPQHVRIRQMHIICKTNELDLIVFLRKCSFIFILTA